MLKVPQIRNAFVAEPPTLSEVAMSDLSLTAQDRCDCRSCGAQAYVRAWINTDKSCLLYCGHHWAEHRDAFTAAGGVHYSELDKLETKLDASA
jgi:hypothetical protein